MTQKKMSKVNTDIAVRGKVKEKDNELTGVHFEMSRFEAITSQIPSGVTSHDSEGRIIHADEYAQKLLGLSLDEIKGRKLTDPIWKLKKRIPKNLPSDLSLPEIALERGEVLSDMIFGINRPDTKELRWLLITAIPVFQKDDDHFDQVFCQLQDITDAPRSLSSIKTRLELLQEFAHSLEVSGLATQSQDLVIKEILAFLPSVFTCPEITQARILIDDVEFTTNQFEESDRNQSAEIRNQTQDIGQVEFHYQVTQEYDINLSNLSADQVLLDTLANWLSLISQIIAKNDEIETLKEEALMAYDRTIEAWSAALETQDIEASGHTKRVLQLALELAKELGFEDDELIHVRRGALLHDIGKLSIPDEIILKPGKLTDDEFAVVKKHPIVAQKWLSQIEMLKPALQIPYYHHERWDGTGYPDGLVGEEIPLVARMFAIVDVWDALISDRPYRSAMSKEDALDLIMSEAGTHFDPNVAESFLKVLSRGDHIDTSHEIKIYAFDQGAVWVQNKRVSTKDWQVHAARDLFFLLIANPNGLSKEQVGLEMWPDNSVEELDIRFKNTLYRLRRAVGNHVILLHDNGYRFNKMLDYFYDVETFESRIQMAQIEDDIYQKITHLVNAVQLHKGEYLPQVDELWVIPDREKYRLMYLNAMVQLAELYHEQNDYKSALNYCNRAIEEDPVFEDAYRLAMRIHAAIGNRAEIIRNYESCQAAFEERFNMPPSKQTHDLYEELVNL